MLSLVGLLCEIGRKLLLLFLKRVFIDPPRPARGWQPLPHFQIVVWAQAGSLRKQGKRAKVVGMDLPTFLPRDTIPHLAPLLPHQSQVQVSVLSGSHSCTAWLIQSLQLFLHLNSVLRKTWSLSQRKQQRLTNRQGGYLWVRGSWVHKGNSCNIWPLRGRFSQQAGSLMSLPLPQTVSSSSLAAPLVGHRVGTSTYTSKAH